MDSWEIFTHFVRISNSFFLMKIYKFWLRFHWSLFPMAQSTTFQHWFKLWLGACQATSHYLNQLWLNDIRKFIIWKSLTMHMFPEMRYTTTGERAYNSAYHDCMLFNNPNSHRAIESLVMTCSENGRDLFKANLNSLLFGKFRGLRTNE